MMSKFNKNGVLTGYVESFCLVCQTTFQSSDDASEHIELTMHLENLDNYPYLDKYKDDHIRKVDSGYFCEFCNILEPTAAKIVLHIADTKHSYAKNSQMLTLRGGNVQFGNILLSNEAWNGLKEDSCMICNVEFDNISIHKTEKDHVLKLVQSKIEFGENGSLYRKMDNDILQCLTCNSMLDLKSKTNHSENSQHIKLYNDSKIEVNTDQNNNVQNQKEDMKNDNSKNENRIKNNPIDILVSDDEFNDVSHSKMVGNGQNNENVHMEEVIQYDNEASNQNNEHRSVSMDVVPLKCLRPDDKGEETNIPFESIQEDSVLAESFATENKIVHNYDNSNAYCRICKNRFSSSLKCMQEHVNGKVHQKNVSLEEAKPKYTVELTRKFIDDVVNIVCHDDYDEIVINDKFLIKEKSFHLMAVVARRFRCYVCDVNVHPSEFNGHVQSNTHKKSIINLPVVTSFNTEFVREIRPGVFHCGFCDVIASSWSELMGHLKCTQHGAEKISLQIRLGRMRRGLEYFKRQQRTIDFLKFLAFIHCNLR